jgi:glycosyltransferase involved in cell wall biosynthesis
MVVDGGSTPTTSQPHVSVVMPVRNGAGTIAEQLDALLVQRTTYRFEVIVIDNGSTDETRAIASGYESRSAVMRLLDGAACRGAAAARNLGAASARGSIVLFCDADDVVDPAWVEKLATAIESRDLDVAAGVCHLDALNDPEVLEWRPFPARPHWNGVPYGLTCNMAVRRRAFQRLGGFSDDFPRAGAEDIDFFVRAHGAQLRVDFVDDAVVHYRFRPDLRGLLRQFYGYGLNEVVLYEKHRKALGLRGSSEGVRQLFRSSVGAVGAAARGDRVAMVRHLRLLASRCGRVRQSVAHRIWAV